MHSDKGQENTGAAGNDGDEAVWLDLVARLEAPGFMDDNLEATPEKPQAPGHKGVVDFDPLEVWRTSSAPAPQEDDPHQGTLHSPTDFPTGPRDYEAQDADDTFVPEELPSLAGTEPVIMLSWIGAVGGPLFLVLAAIFWRGMPLLAVIGVIVAFLAGTGYLLFRLPANRDHDSGDGAVV